MRPAWPPRPAPCRCGGSGARGRPGRAALGRASCTCATGRCPSPARCPAAPRRAAISSSRSRRHCALAQPVGGDARERDADHLEHRVADRLAHALHLPRCSSCESVICSQVLVRGRPDDARPRARGRVRVPSSSATPACSSVELVLAEPPLELDVVGPRHRAARVQQRASRACRRWSARARRGCGSRACRPGSTRARQPGAGARPTVVRPCASRSRSGEHTTSSGLFITTCTCSAVGKSAAVDLDARQRRDRSACRARRRRDRRP